MPAPKRPKSRSEGFGTNRRCPRHSQGPPRPTHGHRRAHRPIAAHGVSGRGGKQRPSQWKLAIEHAERRPSPWAGALSRGAASDGMWSYRENRNRSSEPERRERTSPCRITYIRGRAPFSAPRSVRRDPGVHSRLIRAVSIWRAGQSCID